MYRNRLGPMFTVKQDWRRLEKCYYNTDGSHPMQMFARGQLIPFKPSEVWQVCQGVVRLSTLHLEGEEALLGLAGPSMLFGACLSILRAYQATALSNVYAVRLSLAEVESSPRLAQDLLYTLSRRLQQTEALLAIVTQQRVEDRLRQLLGLLKQEIGQPVQGGTRLSVRFTHEDLAHSTGSTRVTISRIVGKLKEQGWIAFDQERHIVLNERFF